MKEFAPGDNGGHGVRTRLPFVEALADCEKARGDRDPDRLGGARERLEKLMTNKCTRCRNRGRSYLNRADGPYEACRKAYRALLDECGVGGSSECVDCGAQRALSLEHPNPDTKERYKNGKTVDLSKLSYRVPTAITSTHAAKQATVIDCPSASRCTKQLSKSKQTTMFSEFFCQKSARTAWAWAGLVLYLSHAVYRSFVKYRINNWYANFYDVLQSGVAEAASGDQYSGDPEDAGPMRQMRQRVWLLLVDFVLIVLPNLAIHPLSKMARNFWTFSWRTALVRAYLERWKTSSAFSAVEGAAQRVHEDTRLFASGIGGIVMLAIDAVVTLLTFVPILHGLGHTILPPGQSAEDMQQSWLVSAVLVAAVVGTAVTVLIGRRLVFYEIALQRVESTFRTLLVWLESSPEHIIANLNSEEWHPPHAAPTPSCSTLTGATTPDASTWSEGGADTQQALMRPFRRTLHALWAVQARLFVLLCAVSAWLSCFDEAAVVAPLLLAAPLVFADDPLQRITLGTLVQFSNVCGHVFGALSTVANSYPELNAFAAVVVRLREFESAQRAASEADAALLQPQQPGVAMVAVQTASEEVETAEAETRSPGARSDDRRV